MGRKPTNKRRTERRKRRQERSFGERLAEGFKMLHSSRPDEDVNEDYDGDFGTIEDDEED